MYLLEKTRQHLKQKELKSNNNSLKDGNKLCKDNKTEKKPTET